MLPIQPIKDTLKNLQLLYDSHTETSQKIYFSKLAILELCGWLEAVEDEIIKGYASVKLSGQSNIEITEMVKRNYGFEYKGHLRPMIIQLVGIKGIETLENNLEPAGVLEILIMQLSSLWALRSILAHTSTVITGATQTYQAPSCMTTYLRSLHPILTTLENELNQL